MSERHVARRDGTVWTRMVGDGSKNLPLVCVPGGPGCAHDYLANLASLAGHGQPVVFYDPFGSGRSPAPVHATRGVASLCDDIEAVRVGLGVERMHLFAQSAGAFAAIEYALAHPQHVATLVLSSPIVDVPQHQHHVRRLIDGFGATAAAAFVRAEHDVSLRDAAYLTLYYAFIARHVCRFGDAHELSMLAGRGFDVTAHQAMKGGFLLYLRPPLDRWTVAARLPAIRVPVLVTCGAHDLNPTGFYEDVARRFPRGELFVFEHSSHTQHFEQPGPFIDVVAAFLARFDHEFREAVR